MSYNAIFQNGFVTIKLCKHGYFAYNKYDTDVSHYLDLYGEWCDEELQLFDEILSPGDVVLDIGAYIGTHTIFFAQRVGAEGKVLAFEPQQVPFQLLNTNLTLNAIFNTKCYQMGVSDCEGYIKIPNLNPYLELNFGHFNLEAWEKGDSVPLVTIDSLNLDQCDHIKVDVEGMESKVIRGAKQTISKFKPTLYVENNKVNSSKELLKTIFDLNYDCWWHFVPYYNPLSSNETFYSNQVEFNLVCFPKEKRVQPKILLPVETIDDDKTKALERLKNKLKPS